MFRWADPLTHHPFPQRPAHRIVPQDTKLLLILFKPLQAPFIVKDRREILPQMLAHLPWPDMQAPIRRRDRHQGPCVPTAQHRPEDLTQRPFSP